MPLPHKDDLEQRTSMDSFQVCVRPHLVKHERDG